MLRSICVGIFLGLMGVSTATAQVGEPELQVSAEFLSKYIWNGSNRVESTGLSDSPVFQPRVDLGMGGSPLRAHVLGSFTLDQDGQLHEAVYGLSAARSLLPRVRLLLGYDYYDNQTSVIDENANDVHEVTVGLKLDTPSGVVPSAVLKFENPVLDGAESYYVAQGSLQQTIPVVPAVAGAVGVNVSWSSRVLYYSSVKVNDVEVVGSGVGAWQFGISSEIVAGGVLVVPQVHYQVSVDDAINPDNPFWAGLGVAYAF